MLSEQQLIQLEELAAAFTSVEDAAIILQVGFDALNRAVFDVHTPEHSAYNRGRLLNEYEVRQSIVNQAKQRSSPAQVLAMKLINELKMSNA